MDAGPDKDYFVPPSPSSVASARLSEQTATSSVDLPPLLDPLRKTSSRTARHRFPYQTDSYLRPISPPPVPRLVRTRVKQTEQKSVLRESSKGFKETDKTSEKSSEDTKVISRLPETPLVTPRRSRSVASTAASLPSSTLTDKVQQVKDAEEENSLYKTTEHDTSSSHSSCDVADEDESDPEDDDQAITARLLTSLFHKYQCGQGGCGQNLHLERHQAHMDVTEPGNHYPLSVTYATDQPYLTSGPLERQAVGLRAEDYPRPIHQARRRFMEASEIRTLVEGRDSFERYTRNVCLHEEEHHNETPCVEWDVDSLFIFPRSLSAFRAGIRLSFALEYKFNLDSDVHIERQIPYVDSRGRRTSRTLQLQFIPHLYVGTAEGLNNSALHIFFPGLYDEDNKGSWLTKNQYILFWREIFWPACRAYLQDGNVQHFPPDPEMAEVKGKAKSREQQSAKYSRNLQVHRNYLIEPSVLGSIWREVEQTVRSDLVNFKEFQDLFLVLNAKNLKVDFRNSESLFQSISTFETRIGSILNTGECEIILDLGIEICPPQLRGTRRPRNEQDIPPNQSPEALVLMWKTCCLKHELKLLQEKAFNNALGSPQFYHPGFLQDVSCLTICPPKKSRVYQGGWYYAQWYHSAKEIEDAQKVYPFDHDQLWKLAVDEQIALSSSFLDSRRTLERSYIESKKRVSQSYEFYKRTSFGQRFEVRTTYAVVRRMRDVCSRRNHAISPLIWSPETSWPVTMESYASFKIGNFEKYCSLLECVILANPRTGLTFESSQLIYCLLLCLQNFSSFLLPSKRLLWLDEREIEGKLLKGLGFEYSIPEHGFGWWSPIFDWNRWALIEDFQGELVAAAKLLRSFYSGSPRLASNTHFLMQQCFERLRNADKDFLLQQKILHALAHYVLREYRRDILDLLGSKGRRRELKAEIDTDEKKDSVQFCFDGFQAVLSDAEHGIHLVTGHRTRCRSPDQLFEWIMGNGPGWTRTHFTGETGTTKSYRVMLEKVNLVVKELPEMPQLWRRCLADEMFKYHWLIPYPDSNGTLISVSDKGGHRSFYAVRYDARQRRWVWAVNQPLQGGTPSLPSTLQMNSDELRAYFDQCASQAAELPVRAR